MGGGGMMRAAAKVAGIGVFSTGLRAENPVTAAARKVVRPVVSSAISSEEIKLDAALHDDNKDESSSVVQQRQFWDIDDWEFAGGEDVEAKEKMPRVLFGGAPTIEEAKEATSELRDALEKTYLSPTSSNNALSGSFASSQGSSQESEFSLSYSEHIENITLTASETAVTSMAPTHALQAFQFLNESPAAQTVVASIASDPNVWYAVLQNEALVEYIHSQKTIKYGLCSILFHLSFHIIVLISSNLCVPDVAFSTVDATTNESVDSDSPKYYVDESDDSKEPGSGNVIMDYFENIRVKVVDMMNTLSDTIINLFDGPMAEESSSDGKTSFADKAIGASFMGLAVMVIMVVVLKRD